MKNECRKDCLRLAARFTVILSASFSIGVDYVKQRLMKPVWVALTHFLNSFWDGRARQMAFEFESGAKTANNIMNTAEKHAATYLRLNGFLLLPHFTVFIAGPKHNHVDFIGYRLANSKELVCGEELQRDDILSEKLEDGLCATEQAFLPPSARPSDEQWHSALNPKVEPDAELAKLRQSKFRDLLLSRLMPNYDTERYDMADLDERFIKLDLDRADATSDETGENDLASAEEEALGINEEVGEFIYEGQTSKAIQELRSSQPDLSASEAKDIVKKATEALRSMHPEKFI